MSNLTRRETGLPKPCRESKFSGANGDRGKIIFPVQLTTSRIGNLTRLIFTLPTFVYVMTILQYIHISPPIHAHHIPIVGVGKERRTLTGPL